MISVSLVSTSADQLHGWRVALRSEADLLVLDCCASAEDAQRALPARPPQVVVVASPLGEEDGAVLVARLAPRLRETVFLIVAAEIAGVFRALRAGAVGFLLDTDGPAVLAPAVREAQRGGAPITRTAARLVARSFVQHGDPVLRVPEPLSAAESRVLEQLAVGLTYRAAGARLGIAEDTVRAHVRSLYRKLGVNSRADAVARHLEARAVFSEPAARDKDIAC